MPALFEEIQRRVRDREALDPGWSGPEIVGPLLLSPGWLDPMRLVFLVIGLLAFASLLVLVSP